MNQFFIKQQPECVIVTANRINNLISRNFSPMQSPIIAGIVTKSTFDQVIAETINLTHSFKLNCTKLNYIEVKNCIETKNVQNNVER